MSDYDANILVWSEHQDRQTALWFRFQASGAFSPSMG
jgi:hypothetical protein